MAYYYYKEINDVQLHYWLKDGAHDMDAFIQNKCELEFLKISKEIANILDVEILILTEPLIEGGLIRSFRIMSKEEGKKATITIAVVTTLITGIIVTPITTALSKTVEIAIEKILEDEAEKEGKKLDNEEKKLRIEKLKLEIQEKTNEIEQNSKIKKQKSNFYEELEKEPRVEKVSISSEEKYLHKTIFNEQTVYKNDFKKFILVTDRLEPETIDNAIIEIISPVLKKGNYKWKGIYNGTTVSFNMKSNEFKTLIQTGKIEFKNGSAINCLLEIEKQLDNNGDETILAYNILRVNEYFENNQPIETPEGKLSRQKREAIENQIKMFDDEV